MCLDIRLGKRIMKKATTVYKVVRVIYLRGQEIYTPCFFPLSPVFKKGVNHADVTAILYSTYRGYHTYPSGYHCFQKVGDAEAYMKEYLNGELAHDESVKIVEFTIPRGVEVYAGYTSVLPSTHLRNSPVVGKLYTLVSPILILE